MRLWMPAEWRNGRTDDEGVEEGEKGLKDGSIGWPSEFRGGRCIDSRSSPTLFCFCTLRNCSSRRVTVSARTPAHGSLRAAFERSSPCLPDSFRAFQLLDHWSVLAPALARNTGERHCTGRKLFTGGRVRRPRTLITIPSHNLSSALSVRVTMVCSRPVHDALNNATDSTLVGIFPNPLLLQHYVFALRHRPTERATADPACGGRGLPRQACSRRFRLF